MNDFDPTPLIHHPYRAPQGFEAPQVGVYKASTVMFENVAALRTRDWRNKAGYTYGLHGTPTTFTLEERIATLEGGSECLLVPSGLAAIAVVNLALLGQGDEVLLPDNVYGPSRELARTDLVRFVEEFGLTCLHAVLAWSISAPLIFVGTFSAVRPVIARLRDKHLVKAP